MPLPWRTLIPSPPNGGGLGGLCVSRCAAARPPGASVKGSGSRDRVSRLTLCRRCRRCSRCAVGRTRTRPGSADKNRHDRLQFARFWQLGAIATGIRTSSPSPAERRSTAVDRVCSAQMQGRPAGGMSVNGTGGTDHSTTTVAWGFGGCLSVSDDFIPGPCDVAGAPRPTVGQPRAAGPQAVPNRVPRPTGSNEIPRPTPANGLPTSSRDR